MMSNRAEEYRGMIEDMVAHPDLIEPDEWLQLRDLVARVERKLLASMPDKTVTEETAA